MAKGKSLKPGSTVPKRKSPNVDKVHTQKMDSGVKQKRKKMEVEEAPVVIPNITITADNTKQKRNKKHKAKQTTEQTQTEKTEISDLPSCPDTNPELEGEEDLSPEEKRVLERKMKKILKKEAKRRLRDEGNTQQRTEASRPTASQQALDYLTCWAESRTEWKFQKNRQSWLLRHMFDSEMVPDDKFAVLLQYMEGLRGKSRDITMQGAYSLLEKSGKAPEDVVLQQRAHRAGEAIQLLS